MINNKYTQTHTLGAGKLGCSALMHILEQGAQAHVTQMGVSSDELRRQYGAFWMLSRCRVSLNRQIIGPGELVCETAHRDCSGVLVYRDFDLYFNGDPVGEAVQAWIITGVEDRKLFRPQSIPGVASATALSGRTDRLGKLKVPEDLVSVRDYLVEEKDIDVNGHMNNARYIAAAESLLPPEAEILEFQVGYIKESGLGDVICLGLSKTDNLWLVHGGTPAGQSVFTAAFKTAK